MREHNNLKRRAVAGLVTLGLVAAACGSDDSDSTDATDAPVDADTATSAPTGEADSGDVVNLTFQSLAFQEPTIAATEEIVAEWNAANPSIQVEVRQGSWDNVHDQLVTQFQGGTAPDIIHDESADIMGFANQGFLADLTPYLSDDVKASVSDDVWSTVSTSDGAIIAAPTLLQSYVVFANVDAISAAGAEVPAGDSMTWDEFAALAGAMTTDSSHGVGWGLKSPTATVMNLALGFGGTFFDDAGAITVGDAELEVPRRIHDLAYVDGSLDPVTLTQSGGEVLPGFLAGDYAMYVGGNYIAQGITESAPEGFNWVVLPPLAGTVSSQQAANPQTVSVAAESEHVAEAAQFVEFLMAPGNQAKLAQGDWLIPSSATAREEVLAANTDSPAWAGMLLSGESLASAPFQAQTNYPQWKDQFATPSLQQYLADAISIDELQSQLTEGWTQVDG